MLLKDIKTIFHDELGAKYRKEEVDNFFFMFLEHYLDLERFALVLQPGLTITKREEQPFFEGLARLRREEPIQYILGEAYFMDLKFKVTSDVLIPRPETEELVRWLLEDSLIDNNHDIRILDMGTGSGCIAITLAKNLPKAQIHALDLSLGALKVARENARMHSVKVEFVNADILDLELTDQFDIIISNPPYVREMEKQQMQNNVKDHEPESALFVPDDDALKFYRAIVDFSKKRLKKRGRLFLEINQYLAKETQQLLVDNHFEEVELRKDIFGNFRTLKGKVSL